MLFFIKMYGIYNSCLKSSLKKKCIPDDNKVNNIYNKNNNISILDKKIYKKKILSV